MTKFALQGLAMIFMFCDHLGATLLPAQSWLNWVGRLAFPIFAFLLVEGYFHTGDFKLYARRMLLFAVLSEIPMNLMYAGSVIYPFHQNVLWLFLIGLFYLRLLDRILVGEDRNGEKIRAGSAAGRMLLALAATILGYMLCLFTMVDYYGQGLLMILVFYISKRVSQPEEKLPKAAILLFQVLAMYFINVKMLQGEIRVIELMGTSVEITVQGLAILALPLIWSYNGKQGYHSRWWKWFCYAFYPLHMLILSMIWLSVI